MGGLLPSRPAAGRRTAAGLGAHQAPDLLPRRREQVLIAALVNHPALIVEYAEELAGLHFGSSRLAALFRHLIDVAAREPDLDSERIRCHLSEHGFSGLLGEILHPAVYVHGRFARPDSPAEEARIGVRDVIRAHRRRQAALETDAAGRRLAETMSEADLARLEAWTRQLIEGEDENLSGSFPGAPERLD